MVSQFKKNKKRNLKKNIFFSISLGILLLLVIGFLITTNIKINRRRTELTDRIAALKQEIGIVEGKKEELEEKISQAESEEYLEKVALDQFGLKPFGTEVVVVTKDKEKKEEEEKEKKGWWEWIKSKF